MVNEDQKAYSEGLGWLLEMERLKNPNTLNALILNILKIDNGIKNTEFVADERSKKLLVYVELNWWSRKFKEPKIVQEIENMFNEVIPSYRIRVTSNVDILNKAKEIMNQIEEEMKKLIEDSARLTKESKEAK